MSETRGEYAAQPPLGVGEDAPTRGPFRLTLEYWATARLERLAARRHEPLMETARSVILAGLGALDGEGGQGCGDCI